jgi:hypothetical protein
VGGGGEGEKGERWPVCWEILVLGGGGWRLLTSGMSDVWKLMEVRGICLGGE